MRFQLREGGRYRPEGSRVPEAAARGGGRVPESGRVPEAAARRGGRYRRVAG